MICLNCIKSGVEISLVPVKAKKFRKQPKEYEVACLNCRSVFTKSGQNITYSRQLTKKENLRLTSEQVTVTLESEQALGNPNLPPANNQQ